jgi:hypothetical protein
MTLTVEKPETEAALSRGRTLVDNVRIPEAMEQFSAALKLEPNAPIVIALHAFGVPGPKGKAELERAHELAKRKGIPEPERMYIELLLAQRSGDEKRARALVFKLTELLPGDFRAQYRPVRCSTERSATSRRWSTTAARPS